MANNYKQLRSFIAEKYPKLLDRTNGEVYPPPRYAMVISQIVGILQVMKYDKLLFAASTLGLCYLFGWYVHIISDFFESIFLTCL